MGAVAVVAQRGRAGVGNRRQVLVGVRGNVAYMADAVGANVTGAVAADMADGVVADMVDGVVADIADGVVADMADGVVADAVAAMQVPSFRAAPSGGMDGVIVGRNPPEPAGRVRGPHRNACGGPVDPRDGEHRQQGPAHCPASSSDVLQQRHACPRRVAHSSVRTSIVATRLSRGSSFATAGRSEPGIEVNPSHYGRVNGLDSQGPAEAEPAPARG